jgi:hypothetical protein
VTATFTSASVVGPGPAAPPESATTNGGQGISAGQFAEILRAIRAGFTYANVHSLKFPGGEVRGQLGRQHGRGDRNERGDHSGHHD